MIMMISLITMMISKISDLNLIKKKKKKKNIIIIIIIVKMILLNNINNNKIKKIGKLFFYSTTLDCSRLLSTTLDYSRR